MILLLWLSLLALAVVICVLGYFTGDEPYLSVGLMILFLLSTVIIAGNLEYQTGELKNVSFNYTNTTLSSQEEVLTFTYTSWSDSTSQKVGWGMAVISAIGFALSLYNTKKRGAESG